MSAMSDLTAKEQRELTGIPLRDSSMENFAQEVFQGRQPFEAWQKLYDPQNLKSKRAWSAGGSRLMLNELIAARLKTLYQSRAVATNAEQIISQTEVMTKMLEFTNRMHDQDLPQHEAKGIDMLAKATGVYKAPEKNEAPHERTDAEIRAELKLLGIGIDDSTPNRREDGPSRGTEDSEATDLQSLPETEAFSRTRPN